jgi:sugar lactone lactonase YvrE
VPEVQTLMSGLVIGESPRWHDGRLWFSHWGAQQIVAVDLDGNSEVVTRAPTNIGFSIDWLPDGRLLVSGREGLLVCSEHDGLFSIYADLRSLSPHGWNEIVVDGRGNVYVNSVNFDFMGFLEGRAQFAPGIIALVTPDGSVRQVADGIAFPNGMAVTPDNSTLIIAESFARRLTAFDIADDGSLSNRRVWADGVGPDGICMDAEGAIWTDVGEFGDNLVGRVREGRQVLERVQLDMPCFACMLGGEDGKTLFMLAADWRVADSPDDNMTRLTTGPRTGQLLTARAPAAGAGWP